MEEQERAAKRTVRAFDPKAAQSWRARSTDCQRLLPGFMHFLPRGQISIKLGQILEDGQAPQ